jgi:hypothetical protein
MWLASSISPDEPDDFVVLEALAIHLRLQQFVAAAVASSSSVVTRRCAVQAGHYPRGGRRLLPW